MTDKTMLDILSKFADASDESKPLTEGKKVSTADTQMANILDKLQQLNESAEPVAEEAEKKCDDCGKPISKCECDDHDHKEDMDESSCDSKKKNKHNESAIAEAVAQVGAKPLKEYTEFKEMHCNTKRKKMSEEPNEGNEFSGALAKAKASGAKTFKVGDEEYKVTEMFSKHDKVGTKKKTTHGTAEKTATGLKHTRDYKPDYLDLDKDGDKEEPMKKAAKDKKEKKA